MLALYWEGHLLKKLAHKCPDDRIAIGERALPTLLLAVSEFFGIDKNAFASSLRDPQIGRLISHLLSVGLPLLASRSISGRLAFF